MVDMRDFFGDPIYVYTDEDAVRDGVLVRFGGPFPINRVTRAVWEAFTAPMGSLAGLVGSPVTDVTRLSRLLDAVQPLIPGKDDMVVLEHEGRTVWAMPNGTILPKGGQGWTVMFPEDY